LFEDLRINVSAADEEMYFGFGFEFDYPLCNGDSRVDMSACPAAGEVKTLTAHYLTPMITYAQKLCLKPAINANAFSISVNCQIPTEPLKPTVPRPSQRQLFAFSSVVILITVLVFSLPLAEAHYDHSKGLIFCPESVLNAGTNKEFIMGIGMIDLPIQFQMGTVVKEMEKFVSDLVRV